MLTANPLARIVRKLRTRATLDEHDEAAILTLPYACRTYEIPAYIVREGETPTTRCSFVLSGMAYRQKLTSTGGRQILSIHMEGDFLDLQHLFLTRADHSIQALTKLDVVEIEREILNQVALARPAIGRAMWVDALIEASIFREWIVNVGRRDARSRIAHLLCEVSLRMEAAGIAQDHRYELPMSQEQLADATGLTSVHVNRTLMSLTNDGLINRDRRRISFNDWDKIRAVGDFSATYLHLDQTLPLQL